MCICDCLTDIYQSLKQLAEQQVALDRCDLQFRCVKLLNGIVQRSALYEPHHIIWPAVGMSAQ